MPGNHLTLLDFKQEKACQNSFPGNLHLVLVLRPTGFFQRTFTDIGFRFSQEDFILKLPVVMLSSVADLLKYIDEKQLTTEFGGTLEYCHSDWVIFRTAIESFALTVKDIAQMLQAFGTELAEAELPEDIYTIECILSMRTQRYCQLKDDITKVTKEGNMLLSNLEEPSNSTEDLEIRRDRQVDWETVHRVELYQVTQLESLHVVLTYAPSHSSCVRVLRPTRFIRRGVDGFPITSLNTLDRYLKWMKGVPMP